jgi:hypothetical protein
MSSSAHGYLRNQRCRQLQDLVFTKTHLRENRSLDRPWADRINTDLTILQIGGPRPREGTDCCLRRIVDAEAPDTLLSGDRSIEDDGAANSKER